MNQIFESKSLLAKLLAQENLIVEHRKVSTAMFDLKTRTIILPIWKDMEDGILYDLLMGHEVGHALYTPAKGWHDSLDENTSRGFKTYLNVCEDSRIERKMKERYPGLRPAFALAYKKLHEQDLFGLNGLDIEKLRLVDRINIFYKLGAHIRVSFLPEELVFIDRLNVADTWEEIEVIAKDMYDYALEQRKNEPEKDQTDDDEAFGNLDGLESSGEDSEEFDGDDYDFSDEESDEDGDGEDGKESKEGKDQSYTNKAGNGSHVLDNSREHSDDDEVASVTDRAQRRNESALVDNSSGKIHILNIPKANRENYFISHKTVHGAIESSKVAVGIKETSYAQSFMRNNDNLYPELLKRVNPVVNYMVKEFEMRKNATQLARARVGKSGKIDPKKLSRFNIDQDIFKRITSVPQGKNHGLVMFIDLSGSMTSIIQKTFEQAILLTIFCRKVNLPFEVYGFTDHYACADLMPVGMKVGEVFSKDTNDLQLTNGHFYIKQYLSSTMNSISYRAAVNNMLYIGAAFRAGVYEVIPQTEHLYGTPLDESIVASIDLVSDFKNGYKLDIVNCIFLTDGLGCINRYYYDGESRYNSDEKKLTTIEYNDTSYIQHKDYKIRIRQKSLLKDQRHSDNFTITRSLIEIAKHVTGAKYTGYFIGSKNEIAYMVMPYEYTYNYAHQREQRKDILRKIADKGFYSSNVFGFDEYFLVEPNSLKVEETNIDVADGAKKSALTKAFMKSVNNRGLQRMFLNKFVQNLAT